MSIATPEIVAPSKPAEATEEVIGKVASPPHREATTEEFHFWVEKDVLVERSQIVRTDSTLGGQKVRFYGVVKEVFRQSRQSDIAEEVDRHDGDASYTPPYDSPGFTYAKVSILRTMPPFIAPPVEGSEVVLGAEAEAAMAYAADEINPEDALAVGLVKNGGTRYAGPGKIDLNYLLGANGGHLNVTGVAGRGAKSTFLIHLIYLLLKKAREQERREPGNPHRLRVVPIILNVKGFDLFHIDRRNRNYNEQRDGPDWAALGVESPGPLENVTFYAPSLPRLNVPRDTGRPKNDTKGYSWSLGDVIEHGLMSYLFAEEDVNDANFGALTLDVEHWLTDEKVDGQFRTVRRLRADPDNPRPRTFGEFLDRVREWSRDKNLAPVQGHHPATWQKFYRRLLKLVYEGDGVLRKDQQQGSPLKVTAGDTRDPVVVDLSSLAAVPSLQRFVVATIFRQLVDDRTGSAARTGLVYLVTLDELNRFAPRGSHDPITELIETVAAEMRSQGIILLGAQQQASRVSTRVVENAGIRALGKTGPVELSDQTWKFLDETGRRKASNLGQDEKLLMQDSFREPMLVKLPFPPWAMRGADAADEPPQGGDGDTGGLDNP